MKEQISLEQISDRSDEELIRLVAKNNSEALAKIYDRYSRLVFSLALKTLCDRATAEEVVQDVFTKVWRGAYEFDPARGTLLGWLVGIAHHRCIDELRRRRVRPTIVQDAWSVNLADENSDPFGPVLESLRRQEIFHALELIPPEQRKVIECAFFRGLSQTEIAAHLDMPLGTVKSRLRLGMQKLKDLLEEN